MKKIRYIEIPHHDRGNGLRYGKTALEMINAVRTELHALDVDLWKQYGHDVEGIGPSLYASLADVWNPPRCRATLMLVDGESAAFVMNQRPTPTFVSFWHFIVAQPFRRNGYGKLLMQHSIEMHRKLGFTEMSLNVHANNPHAFAMYHAAGFEPKMVTMSLKLQGT